MARLIALYKTPKDTAEFDRYYVATHAPLAKGDCRDIKVRGQKPCAR